MRPLACSIAVRSSVQSGTDEKGEWVLEKRDVVSDYEMLFGKAPSKDVVGVGLMVDSDNTETEAEAYYRRITVGTLLT